MAVGASRTATDAAVKSAKNPVPTPATIAAPTAVASSVSGTPSGPASQSVLPPLTNPGFSISHEPGTAWPCVSTRQSVSRTGAAETVVTGSAVPVTSTTTPGSIAPAPTDAACSSPVPTTTAQLAGRPNSAAMPGSSVPTTSVDGRTGANIDGSSSAAAHRD